MTVQRSSKGSYTELEAAQELGVSVDRLRHLIRTHIVQSDEELSNVSNACFQASDMLLLKLLCRQAAMTVSRD